MEDRRFTIPRDLYFGRGALGRLRELDGRRAMLVADRAMRQNGFAQRAEELLREAGLEVRRFEEVEPDPSVETVMKGAKALPRLGPIGSWPSGEAPSSTRPRRCGFLRASGPALRRGEEAL